MRTLRVVGLLAVAALLAFCLSAAPEFTDERGECFTDTQCVALCMAEHRTWTYAQCDAHIFSVPSERE